MMMKIMTRMNYFCAGNRNLAFKSVTDATVREQIITPVVSNSATQQKLDALTNVIISLSNVQVQYLVGLQNQRILSQGSKLADSLVYSVGDDKATTIEYLYQKKWVQEVWKDYHILSSLFSDQGDNEGVQEVVQQTKEIYEFQLTSVDAAQKIKIIKVIRELLSLGLKEAKDIVDKAPIIMKKGKKEQGEKLKQELAKSGCVVTLK